MSVDNRVKFFTRFAIENGFDPLLPDNWYKIKHVSVLETKV